MKSRRTTSLPEARNSGLLLEQVGNETIVFDTETNEAHCLRPVAASVFARCDGRNSVETLSALVSRDVSEDVSTDAVEDALAQLREHGLLAITERDERSDDGISRRLMLQKSAAAGGAVMAASMIASIVAPTPAFAASVCNAGAPCNTARDCGCPSNSGCKTSAGATCDCKPCVNCGTPPRGYSGWCFFHGGHGNPCGPPCFVGNCSPCD